MEPEGSLLHSQVPTTCPYFEPARSSPHPHFLKLHRNIILSSAPGFPRQKPVHTSSPHTRYMPHPSHSSWFYHSHDIWWRVQIIKFLICIFLHSSITSSLLDPNIILNTLFSNTPSLRSSLNVSEQVSHPYKTTGKIIVQCILISKILDSKLEDKRFCTEWQEAFPDLNRFLISSWIEFDLLK
jgi:hypothetical protein